MAGLRVGWYVFGAQAVLQWGRPRFTEDLIVTKVLAGRPRDLEDARSVVQAKGDALDRDAVQRTLGMLEEALGVSDLVPMFERLTSDPA